MERGVLFAGNLIVDMVKIVNTLPARNNLARILDVQHAVGGLACNNAINMKVLDPGLHVGVAGRIGHDDLGQLILSRLNIIRVDTSAVIVDKETPTSFTDVMTEQKTGERTFFHYFGANANWSPDDVNVAALSEKYGFVHAGYMLLLKTMDEPDAEHGTKLGLLLHRFREAGVKTCLDIVSDQDAERLGKTVPPALSSTDVVICNEYEACASFGLEHVDSVTGEPNWKNMRCAVDMMFEAGVREMVVVHAAKGSIGRTRDGDLVTLGRCVVPPEQIAGAAGAGDAFASGVIYGLCSERSLENCIRLGTAMGAMNLFDPTTTGGARPLAEVETFLETHPIDHLPI